MSPYSYLAATQIEGLAARTCAALTWLPVHLPGIMRATGNHGPMEVPAKGEYTFKDLRDWTAHYGLPPVKLPQEFPFRAVTANRLCLAAGERCAALARNLFHKIWAEGRDPNDEAVQRAALSEVGLDVEACLQRANSDALKDLLKTNTDAAVSRGAFGVPTFWVDGTQMFVDNDRLLFVEKALTS
jgi:2-hydroxychromene-2-carboxylate isomerase